MIGNQCGIHHQRVSSVMFCIFETKIIFFLHWFCYLSYFVANHLDTTGSGGKLEIPRQNGKTSHPTKVLDVTFRPDIS